MEKPPRLPMIGARRFLLVLGAIVLLFVGSIGLWYAVEDYRGAQAWAETHRRLEAQGESLDAARFIPPPVPDDQNLAMAPLFERLYHYQVDPVTKQQTFGKTADDAGSQTILAIPFGTSNGGPVRPPPPTDWTSGHVLDLGVYQRYYARRKDFPHAPTPQAPAEDVRLALTRYDAIFDEVVRAAAVRPLTRFPVNWTQRPWWYIALPHHNSFQALVQGLRLRACAGLSLGQADNALSDVELGLRLSHDSANEPTLIGDLVGVTCYSLLLQPVWEGLAARKWSGAQLAELQTRFGETDLLRTFRQAEQFERATFVAGTREELRRPEAFKEILAFSGGASDGKNANFWLGTMGYFFPRGWADLSAAYACLWLQQNVINTIDVPAHRINPRRVDKGFVALHNLKMTPTTFLVKFGAPLYQSVELKNVRTQAYLDEVLTACALERFYQDHQAYPPNLQELVPAYLPRVPNDVIDGAPLRYQQTPAGRYRLWEVGWNGRDEGGTVIWNKDGKRLEDRQGDWIWQYTPLSPP